MMPLLLRISVAVAMALAFAPTAAMPITEITAAPFGGVPDGQRGVAVVTAGSPALGGITTRNSDHGKIIGGLGLGVAGHAWSAHILSAGLVDVAPTNRSGTWYGVGDGQDCPVSSILNASGYVAGEVVTLPTTNANAPTRCVIEATAVGTATVVSAGAGALASTCIVIGTTGVGPAGGGSLPNGIPFSANVAISNGGIDHVISVLYPGEYRVNPTVPSAEPVTSAGPGCAPLTGAVLALTLGPAFGTLLDPGDYSAQPAATQVASSSTGVGQGAVYAIPYAVAGQVDWGTDNNAALNAAMASASSSGAWLAMAAGVYLSSCPQVSDYWRLAGSGRIDGAGQGATTVRLLPGCPLSANSSGLFGLGNADGFVVEHFTVDANFAWISGINLFAPRFAYSVFDITGTINLNSGLFDDISVINTGRYMHGAQWLPQAGATYQNQTIRHFRCIRPSADGVFSHCLSGGNGGGVLETFHLDDISSTGENIAIYANNSDARSLVVGGQGYGPCFANSAGPMTPTTGWIVDGVSCANSLPQHDRITGADLHSCLEVYASNTLYSHIVCSGVSGAGFRSCAPNVKLDHSIIHDNATGAAAFLISGVGSPHQQAGIEMETLGSGGVTCTSAGSTIDNTTVYDNSGLQLCAYDEQVYSGAVSGVTGIGNSFQQNNNCPVAPGSTAVFDNISLYGDDVHASSWMWSVGTEPQSSTPYYLLPGGVVAAGRALGAQVPAAVTVTSLNIVTGNTPPTGETFTFTLYAGSTISGMAATTLICAIGATNSCIASGAIAIPANGFYLLRLDTSANSGFTGTMVVSIGYTSAQ